MYRAYSPKRRDTGACRCQGEVAIPTTFSGEPSCSRSVEAASNLGGRPVVYVRCMRQPSRDRPELPDGYGVPDGSEGVLEWFAVETRLRESLHYWMATTRPDGRPHAVPRWGVWMDGRFWYDGAPSTIHVRNLNRSPFCVLHLEDGRQAVMVEGRSEAAEPPGSVLGTRLAAEFCAKYAELGYSPEPTSWEGPHAGGLRVFTPVKAMAWFEFPTDVTRFRF